MKKIIVALLLPLAIIAGYVLGSYFPLIGFFKEKITTDTTQGTEIPQDKARLAVKVQNADNEPVIGIEIDVAFEPGPPQDWGIKETNMQGEAIYDLEPGTYYVFFNMNRFPNEYIVQAEKQVILTKNTQEEVIFTLERK